MNRDGFVFYNSFYSAITTLEDDQQLVLFKAVSEYALHGIEPEISGPAQGIFMLIKPQIDANNRKYENGKKGGRPKTELKPNNNQDETKQEPKEKDKVNVNVKEKDNDLDFGFAKFKMEYPYNSDGIQPGMTEAKMNWAVDTEGNKPDIFKALTIYKQSDVVKNGFVMSAAKFVKTAWKDWIYAKSPPLRKNDVPFITGDKPSYLDG